MKKVVLFGAGQVGNMTARLLGPEFQLLCVADNAEDKWGKSLLGIPIVSPEQSQLFFPDCYCLCVLDSDREQQMRMKLAELGFSGEIFTPASLKMFDTRAATMRLLAEQINEYAIPGDVAELGVYKGDFARLINAAFPERSIHLFDTFEGFTEQDVSIERANGYSGAKVGDFSETTENAVGRQLFCREKAVFHKGFFPDTFQGCETLRFAFVSVDADLYAPTAASLPLFWDRLSPGGVIMVHDYNSTRFNGVRKAVDEFCQSRGILPMPLCDLHGSAVLRLPINVR